jgi:hypothetical protein
MKAPPAAGVAHVVVEDDVLVDLVRAQRRPVEEALRVPAAGAGPALSNPAPKSRSLGGRDTGNQRKHRGLV